MKKARYLILVLLVELLCGANASQASQNLLRNGGFEEAEDWRPKGWSVHLSGEWTGEWKIPTPRIVNLSADARTGKHALEIDTTILNPGGKITDALRTWSNPKYEIFVTQDVHGIDPNSWYIVKFYIKSFQILIDEGMEILSDIKPWAFPTVRRESFGNTRWGSQMVEGRVFLPQVPMTDGQYHEYILLKQTYSQTDTLTVGIRIRAPWTGKILIDDVELIKVDPAKYMSKITKLLALRGAKPIEKVRELNPETTLVVNGNPAGVILAPEEKSYRDYATQIQNKIRQLTGTLLPIVTTLDDVPKGYSIVAVGNMMVNELVARLHFNRYVTVNAAQPGANGYVIWSVPEPYGLDKKQNVIVVAGSDSRGQAAAIRAFAGVLSDHTIGRSIKLPYLHTVYPPKTIDEKDREVDRDVWGFHFDNWPISGFSKWYLPRWLSTGDLEVVRLARKELLKIIDYYLDNPYTHSASDSFEVGLAWDCLEESPVFSDEDRLKITNFLLGYLHIRPQITNDWYAMVPRLKNGNTTWSHQAEGLCGAYTMGRYFERFYDEQDARYGYYLSAVRNTFRHQAKSFKPEENSSMHMRNTIKHALSYYLGEWEMDFFTNEAMRRHAEYLATVCNNKGWVGGFGQTFYCYDGADSVVGFGEFHMPLALWYYRDGRMLWWLKRFQPDYRSPYHQDVRPIEWTELIGVKKTPLERALYDPRSRLNLWGADGEGAEQPAGGVQYAETFDKIAFRENWNPEGQYMLLEGIGRGIHSGRATNQICKLSILGEDLLIGSTYEGDQLRANCNLIVVKDKDIHDPAVRGIPAMGYKHWNPLYWAYPAYAAVEAIADLPTSGFTRTVMRGFLGGTDWARNIFWVKGKYFALIDEVVAAEPGTYYIESNLRTCPNKAGPWPKITPRRGKLLRNDRGYVVNIFSPYSIRHYILTDGTARIKTENAPGRDLSSVVVRQIHRSRKLDAGEKVTYINLLYGDDAGARSDYRIERLSPTEGLIFQGTDPVAYFGLEQSEQTRAILSIRAKMFMLTDRKLSVVGATSVEGMFRSTKGVSREVRFPRSAYVLDKLSKLIEAKTP